MSSSKALTLVAPALRRVIEKACAFEPSSRYQSAEAFAEDLRQLRVELAQAASEAGPEPVTEPVTKPVPEPRSASAAIPAAADGRAEGPDAATRVIGSDGRTAWGEAGTTVPTQQMWKSEAPRPQPSQRWMYADRGILSARPRWRDLPTGPAKVLSGILMGVLVFFAVLFLWIGFAAELDGSSLSRVEMVLSCSFIAAALLWIALEMRALAVGLGDVEVGAEEGRADREAHQGHQEFFHVV